MFKLIRSSTNSNFISLRQKKAAPFAGLRFFLFSALLALISAPSAHALDTSPNALRIEDSREGNVLLGAEAASINAGEVFNTVLLVWGNLAIHGQVDEVIVLSGKVVFHPGAKLGKALVVMGGSFEALPGAEIPDDKITLRAPGPLWRMLRSAGNVWRDHIGWVAKAAGSAVTCALLWLIGSLLFRFFPALQGITANRLGSQWGRNLFAGLAGSVAVPVLMVLLVISLLGIFVLPIYLVLLGFAGIVSYLGAALWAGHRLLPPPEGRGLNYAGFFLGLAALQLFWIVGGWAVLPVLALWTLSWGALLRGLRTLWR
jgi:hypothetical protein